MYAYSQSEETETETQTETDRNSIQLEDIFFRLHYSAEHNRMFRDSILNALSKAGITTVGQLTKLTKEDVLKVPGLNSSDLRIIEEEMARNRISLHYTSELEDIFFTEKPRTPIQERVMRGLRLGEIKTLDQLTNMSEEELRRVSYISDGDIGPLQEEVKRHGYTLSFSDVIENVLFEEEKYPLELEIIHASIMKRLKRAGITTIDKLNSMTKEDLQKLVRKEDMEEFQKEMEKLKSKCNKSFESI